MIPLRVSMPSRHFPLVTMGLIIANGIVFFHQIRLGPYVVTRYALIPGAYLHWPGGGWQEMVAHHIPLVSALFLHGGWFHLISNMWYLWIFGDTIEEALGRFRFLGFYVLCGVAGNLAHVLMNMRSLIPVLGASGCISGVLAAYFLLFPRRKITTLLPIFIFWTVAEVPAFFFLGIWFLIQFMSGFLALPCGQGGPCVAWWAHIGGFVAGLWLTVKITRRRR